MQKSREAEWAVEGQTKAQVHLCDNADTPISNYHRREEGVAPVEKHPWVTRGRRREQEGQMEPCPRQPAVANGDARQLDRGRQSGA